MIEVASNVVVERPQKNTYTRRKILQFGAGIAAVGAAGMLEHTLQPLRTTAGVILSYIPQPLETLNLDKYTIARRSDNLPEQNRGLFVNAFNIHEKIQNKQVEVLRKAQAMDSRNVRLFIRDEFWKSSYWPERKSYLTKVKNFVRLAEAFNQGVFLTVRDGFELHQGQGVPNLAYCSQVNTGTSEAYRESFSNKGKQNTLDEGIRAIVEELGHLERIRAWGFNEIEMPDNDIEGYQNWMAERVEKVARADSNKRPFYTGTKDLRVLTPFDLPSNAVLTYHAYPFTLSQYDSLISAIQNPHRKHAVVCEEFGFPDRFGLPCNNLTIDLSRMHDGLLARHENHLSSNTFFKIDHQKKLIEVFVEGYGYWQIDEEHLDTYQRLKLDTHPTTLSILKIMNEITRRAS